MQHLHQYVVICIRGLCAHPIGTYPDLLPAPQKQSSTSKAGGKAEEGGPGVEAATKKSGPPAVQLTESGKQGELARRPIT